jgi:integrase
MAKKRAHGTGSLVKGANGIYQFFWTDAAGNRHKKSLRTRNRSDAIEKVAEFERAVGAKDRVEVLHEAAKARKIIKERKLPLSEVWAAFEKTNPTAGEGTLKNYRRNFEEFIKWLADQHPQIQSFTDVTPEVVEEYCDHIWQSGISSNTYHYKKNSLGHITKKLAGKYGINENKWTDPDLRKIEVKQKRKPLNCKQALKLLERLDDKDTKLPCPQECRVLVKMLLFTGARLIDAVHMRWDNVNLQQARMEYTPKKTASKGKTAEVPLLPMLVHELEVLYSTKEDDETQIFPKLTKMYAKNPDGIQKPLKSLVQKVTGDGLNEETAGQRVVNRSVYGVHSLRATFATQAAMAGCKSVWLSRMLGDSIQTCDKYYVQAGLGDTLITGFEDLDQLTNGVKVLEPKKEAPEREKLLNLLENLPDEEVQKLLDEYGGAE